MLTIAPAVRDVSQPVRPGTLRLTRLDEVRQSGLTRAVRFELDRRISIAPSHPILSGTGAPAVVGHLCEPALERLQAARARIHALRDMATTWRTERRPRHRNDRASDRRTNWRRAVRSTTTPAQEDRA